MLLAISLNSNQIISMDTYLTSHILTLIHYPVSLALIFLTSVSGLIMINCSDVAKDQLEHYYRTLIQKPYIRPYQGTTTEN